MIRLHPNEHERLSEWTSACLQDLKDSIKDTREEMRQKWADVDQGWQDLEKRMREVGLTMASTVNPGAAVELNVGGSDVNIPRSVLNEMRDLAATWTLAYLFGGGEWDTRLPRSKNLISCMCSAPHPESRQEFRNSGCPPSAGRQRLACGRAALSSPRCRRSRFFVADPPCKRNCNERRKHRLGGG